jgi:L-ascorbate metabolism protein UlaG (beta-lactamase superfamily)
MNIKYFGNSSFLFKAKDTKLVTNPKSDGVKVNLKKIGADIVALSHKCKLEEDGYYIISSCGEYEVKDVFIYGYASDPSNVVCDQADVYVFDLEGIHLGLIDKSVAKIREGVIDEMGVVNVLFVSLSEESKIKISKLNDLVSRIEPQIVIPMDYTKENLDKFLKAVGVKEPEKVDKLSVKRTDFSEEDMPIRVVVLEK